MQMEADFPDIGIPPLSSSDQCHWQRTWVATFTDFIDRKRVLTLGENLNDSSIAVTGIPVGDSEASIVLCSNQSVEYVDFWDNGFRIMLLLDQLVGTIKMIEGRERRHWRRFFFQADHESTLDRYKTRLMICAKKGDEDAVIDAIQAGAIDEKSFSGKTALMYAAQYGQTEVAKFLLASGATVNVCAHDWGPLELAVRGGSIQIVQMFVEAGADINAQNYYGETPLMWSAATGATDIIEFLIRNDADVSKIDDQGRTVHDWAARVLDNVNRRQLYESVIRLLSS